MAKERREPKPSGGAKASPTALTPNAAANWWRACIHKEESLYGGPAEAAAPTSFSLNPLGVTDSRPKAAHTHLYGPGAVVRGGKDHTHDPLEKFQPAGAAQPWMPMGGSVAGSAAARSTSSTAVMSRLSKLEQDLKEERERRRAAEAEMKALLKEASSKQPAAAASAAS